MRRHRTGRLVLERLVGELRAEPAPKLPWERMEAELRARLRSAPEPGRNTSRHYLVPVLAAILLLGLAVSVLLLVRGSSQQAPMVARFDRSAVLDGDRLAAGTEVVAKEQELRIEHRDRATWVLLPHSRARLAGVDQGLVVVLDRGSLLAQVEPHGVQQGFAIEAAETRVTATGTVFWVELLQERIRVSVERGSVRVRPVRAPETERGYVLEAPGIETFSLDGRRKAESAQLARTRVSAGRSPQNGAPSQQPTGLPRASSEQRGRDLGREDPGVGQEAAGGVPETISTEDLEAGVQKVVDLLSACFAISTQPRADLLVTLTFDLELTFGPEGEVSNLACSPPLPPAVEACAEQALVEVRAPSSQLGATARRRVSLHR